MCPERDRARPRGRRNSKFLGAGWGSEVLRTDWTQGTESRPPDAPSFPSSLQLPVAGYTSPAQPCSEGL